MMLLSLCLGAFGIDFTLPSQTIEDDVCQVSRGLLQHGVTAYCPTIITSSKDDYKQVNIIISLRA